MALATRFLIAIMYQHHLHKPYAYFIIVYLTYYVFLQERLKKSRKLTKLINILLHNAKKLLYTGYFFVNHVASSFRSLSWRSL